jgi:hypothetical protein
MGCKYLQTMHEACFQVGYKNNKHDIGMMTVMVAAESPITKHLLESLVLISVYN